MKAWNPEKALERIEQEGRTRKWLADQCEIEVESLNHILSGTRKPGRPVLKLMAHALNTTVEFLLGETALDQTQLKQKAVVG